MTDKFKKEYIFNGWDYMELVEYFGLEQINEKICYELEEFTSPEYKNRDFTVGLQTITINTNDKEEVGLIKLEKYLSTHLYSQTNKTSEVRKVLNAFLDKLIIESKDLLIYDQVEMFKNIRNIKDNYIFGVWFINNLTMFWN